MGFYGNIRNTTRTQFAFDKIYPSRTEMDSKCPTDQIYVGRYVLVEYDSHTNLDNFRKAFKKNGILYWYLPTEETSSEMVPMSTLKDTTTGMKFYPVEAGDIVCVPGLWNFDEENAITQFYEFTGEEEKIDWVTYKVNKIEGTELKYELVEFERQDTAKLTHAVANLIVNEEIDAGSPDLNSNQNYIVNFSLDVSHYSTSRGFDSTVWQKTYVNGAEKYVMVAELNTVVPTFDISADAPSVFPIVPHFDADSTNVYYRVHWQPSWGIRFKVSDSQLRIPVLSDKGEPLTGVDTVATSINYDYPSDEWITLTRDKYDNVSGLSKKQYLDVKDHGGVWEDEEPMEDNGKVAAAVYYNKDGFDPKYHHYSGDVYWVGLSTDTDDYGHSKLPNRIELTPTGYSGNRYETHDGSISRQARPDTQELSILLPTIGDTIANIWDIVYGDRHLNGYGPSEMTDTERALDIEWKDAKATTNKKGLRLFKQLVPGQYDYNKAAGSTLAGVINSAQDLMGMIITPLTYKGSEITQEEIDALNENYIYYDETTNKYKFKRKTYVYTPVENEQVIETVSKPDYSPYTSKTFQTWDKNAYFYVDTNRLVNHSCTDFIADEVFHGDMKYLAADTVKDLMTDIPLSDSWTFGTCFVMRQDPNSKLSYFTPDTDAWSNLKTYYLLKEYKASGGPQSPLTIDDLVPPITIVDDYGNETEEKAKIYIPNTYYYIDYTSPLKPGDDRPFSAIYEPGIYWYPKYDGDDCREWVLATGTLETNTWIVYDETTPVEQVVPLDKYRKKEYFLSTALYPDYSKDYYYIDLNNNKDSSFYQLQYVVEPVEGLDEITFIPGKYFREFDEEETKPDGGENYVDFVYLAEKKATLYVDTGLTPKPNAEYYTVKKQYVLIEGQNSVEISDENAQLAYNLIDLNFFKTRPGSPEIYYNDPIKPENDPTTIIDRYFKLTYSSYPENPTNYTFYVMAPEQMHTQYGPATYYYVETDNTNGKAGSYMMDDNSYMWKDKEADQIAVSRQYYKFDTSQAGSLVPFSLDGRFYEPNKYYEIKNGEYVLSTDPYTPGKTYYKKDKAFYVSEDEKGVFTRGAEWNHNALEIPEGLHLATRTEQYELVELEGFADHYNTLFGLLLRLNKTIDETDTLTRNEVTVRGAINKLNDIIAHFSTMKPSNFVVVDNYGRLHSSEYSSKQGGTFTNIGKPSASGDIAEAEDRWIRVDMDSNITETHPHPSLTFEHEFLAQADTVTDSNKNGTEDGQTAESIPGLNTGKGDTLKLYTPIVDSKGHVVGKNTETVTLPFGFKKITTNGKGSNTAINATANLTTDTIIADNTQDTFAVNSGDKWIRINTTANNDTIVISHDIHAVSPTTSSASLSNENSQAVTFEIPTYSFDEAGHYSGRDTKTLTMPYAYGKITGDASTNNTAASATYDTVALNGDSWIKTTTDTDKVTFTHIGPVTTTHTKVDNETPQFGSTFTIVDWTFDSKGHKANNGTHTVKIPQGSLTETTGKSVNNVLTDISFAPATGAITVNRTDVGLLKIAGYSKPTAISGGLSEADTINSALGKLEFKIEKEVSDRADAINALDSSTTDLAVGEYITKITIEDGKITNREVGTLPTVTDSGTGFVTAVTQTNGEISVEKAELPIATEYDAKDEENLVTGSIIASALESTEFVYTEAVKEDLENGIEAVDEVTMTIQALFAKVAELEQKIEELQGTNVEPQI